MAIKDVRITVLVENQADDGMMPEHGLSLWIEAGGKHILFDTGQGDALPHNTAKLGVDIGQADSLVLSHGHYDHTGGLPHVLDQAPRLSIHCHPGAVRPRYSIQCQTGARAIHMPQAAVTALSGLPSGQLHWVRKPRTIAPHIGLTGPIPRKNAYEDTGGAFYLEREGRWPDAIDDELALWINTPRGLIIVVGCCHAGLINTIEYIQATTGVLKVHAVIGGLHLANVSVDRLARTCEVLKGLAIERLVTCHCTGAQASGVLQSVLGDTVSTCHCGDVLALYGTG
jgi:7,8-dihydropterin-6-yl-methyl-4-(beta-D-ribofuranosyl)aminobenzene 5'-phosphate synthase